MVEDHAVIEFTTEFQHEITGFIGIAVPDNDAVDRWTGEEMSADEVRSKEAGTGKDEDGGGGAGEVEGGKSGNSGGAEKRERRCIEGDKGDTGGGGEEEKGGLDAGEAKVGVERETGDELDADEGKGGMGGPGGHEEEGGGGGGVDGVGMARRGVNGEGEGWEGGAEMGDERAEREDRAHGGAVEENARRGVVDAGRCRH